MEIFPNPNEDGHIFYGIGYDERLLFCEVLRNRIVAESASENADFDEIKKNVDLIVNLNTGQEEGVCFETKLIVDIMAVTERFEADIVAISALPGSIAVRGLCDRVRIQETALATLELYAASDL